MSGLGSAIALLIQPPGCTTIEHKDVEIPTYEAKPNQPSVIDFPIDFQPNNRAARSAAKKGQP